LAIGWQQEFLLYTSPGNSTKHFRIRHSGTINPAGNAQLGWQRLENRYSAGQTDVLLGLTALWLLTRAAKYANLAVKILQRYPGAFWSEADGRWYISPEGASPFPHGWTVFGQTWSRIFSPASLFVSGLQALEPHFTFEAGVFDGGIQPPGYTEAEHIFSAFYAMGQNQLAAPTAKNTAAREYVKAGQYFLTLGGQQVGGIVFSRRYPYLYTNIAGFACLALANTLNPFTEQLPMPGLGVSRMLLPQYGERG
jgi:hypothetical protein